MNPTSWLTIILLMFTIGCSSLQKSGLINSRGQDYLKAELIKREPTKFMPNYKNLYELPYLEEFSTTTLTHLEYPALSFIPAKTPNIINKPSVATGQNVLGEPMLKVKAPLQATFDASVEALGAWYSSVEITQNETYQKVISLTYKETPILLHISIQSNFSIILISHSDETIYLLEDTASHDVLLQFRDEFQNAFIKEIKKAKDIWK